MRGITPKQRAKERGRMANRVQEITSELPVQEEVQSPTSVSSPETLVFTKPSRFSSFSFDPGGASKDNGYPVRRSERVLDPPSTSIRVLVSFPLSTNLIVEPLFADLIFAKFPKHRIHVFDPGGNRDVANSAVGWCAFSYGVRILLGHVRRSNPPQGSHFSCASEISWSMKTKTRGTEVNKFHARLLLDFVLMAVASFGLLVFVVREEEGNTDSTGSTRYGLCMDLGLMGQVGARSRIEELPSNTTNGTPSFSYTSLVLIDNLMTSSIEEPKGSAWNDTMGQTPACSVNFKQRTQGISNLAQIYDGCPKAHGLLGETHFKEMNTVTTSRLEDKSSFQGVGSVRPLISGIMLVGSSYRGLELVELLEGFVMFVMVVIKLLDIFPPSPPYVLEAYK